MMPTTNAVNAPGPLPLVGLDSCVYIEAAKVPTGLCKIIVELARRRVFRVLMPPRVNYEVRKELQAEGLLAEYEQWLAEADVFACPAPTTNEIRTSVPFIWPKITHCPDYRVAVSVRSHTPRYFITSNTKDRKDWKRSAELRAALGGVSVVVPRQYLEDVQRMTIPNRAVLRRTGSGELISNLFEEPANPESV